MVTVTHGYEIRFSAILSYMPSIPFCVKPSNGIINCMQAMIECTLKSLNLTRHQLGKLADSDKTD